MWRYVGAAVALASAMAGLVPTAAEAARPADPPGVRADVGKATLSGEQRDRRGPVARGLNELVFDTAQSPFHPSTPNQGWWSDTIDAGFANPNYIAGVCCGGDHRNFFTFDLRTLRKHVVTATLRVNTGTVDGDETETLRLSDVSTDAETLNFNLGRNQEIFRDLGTGAVYGEYVISRDQDNVTLDLRLGRAAVRDLNRARGGFFSIGGRVTSLSTGATDEHIFGSSGNTGNDTAQLIIRRAPGGPR